MQPEKKLVLAIIKEQSLIIGEALARSRAEDAGVVKYNSSKIDDFTLTQTNITTVLERLIKSYEEVFGEASAEVCFNVVKKYSSAS